jgi:hypothetical protein
MKTRAFLAMAALVVLAPAALAQAPARDANIWNGNDHDPVPANVHAKEEAAGIAPSAAQQQHETAVVEQEAAKLLGKPQPGPTPGQ